MMAVLLSVKHSMSWVAIIDIINTVNNDNDGDNDVLPYTKYKLFKYFALAELSFQYPIFCSVCEQYVGNRQKIETGIIETCHSCGNQFDESTISLFFVTLNLTSQLKSMLKDPDVVNNLNYRFTRLKKNDEALKDVYDGIMYKKYMSFDSGLRDPMNFSYTFNTDECQASDSSNVFIWPIYVMIHELPPKMRSQHMLLTGYTGKSQT